VETKTKERKPRRRIWWELDEDVIRLAKLEEFETGQRAARNVSQRLRESYAKNPFPNQPL
jgi:hypothetical protein